MTTATTPIEEQIADLERKVEELKGTTRILLMSRLVQDGHAPSWKAAVRMVREDFDGVVALYMNTEPQED